MKRLITASDRYTPKGGYLYIFKHGIGPGTIPSDVSVVKTKDLPNYYTAVWLDRFLTGDELKQYDIPSETEINRYLDRIGYCQKNGDVVPCGEVEACGKVTAYSQMSSRRSRSVTKEVLDYLADQYPNSRLYKELVDKDIWINLWPDGEYNLSYNSIKNPETFLTDASADELVKVMTELYPDSFWGDLVDVETCSKVTASRRVSANKKYVKAFVTQDREDAWALIDQYMEREWGHVEYNESARAILVMEMPFDGISEDGNSYSEGTCAAIINLIDFELRFNVYIPEAEGIAEEDWDHTIKYDSLADMVAKLIQPMADGEITEEKLYEMCESYYY